MADCRQQYDSVLRALLSHEHVFYSPPTSPHKLHVPQQRAGETDATMSIASLSLHPVIESLLHILNCDLPSAHFLCRHAEVDPKWESMYVHGILHRIEGDVDNTRCWYRDVQDQSIFRHAWRDAQNEGQGVPAGARKGWEHFLARVERYRDRTRSRQGLRGEDQDRDRLDPTLVKDWTEEARMLRETSLWEIMRTLEYCENRFGLGQLADASKEFLGRIESGNEEHAKVAQSMVTGGEGWRTF